MPHVDDTSSHPVIPTSDSTPRGVSGIDSGYMQQFDSGRDSVAHRSARVAQSDESVVASNDMTRAVLYARVSTDRQREEATIESQVFELKRQIAAAGHVLVKEYIDDGITGTVMDRAALEQLRQDAKTDLYDRI